MPHYYKVFNTFILSLLLCLCSQAYAQELWTGLTLRVKPFKRLTTEVEQQFRFDNGITSLATTFTEFGVGYDITKRFGIKAAYRNTNKTGSERVDNDKERFSIETSYDIGSDETRFVFSYRLRYQVARETTNRENVDRDDYIRNRFSLDYNLTKKVLPYAATEIFYKLNQNKEIRAYWLTLGLKSTISKNIGLNTFYRVELEQNVKYPKTNYIVGAMLTYRIKLQKKDSDDDSISSDQ
ncbi:DUF2490 domain-containing protein [Rhodocytophaga rosea]|uniref:DUF2490 domain-containing protein n=1 Tax=Rhodocytophaga rosea TaxID=2704465 RepID=A0A6C0GLP6_9BACT|nr:DUF2490 domain-containing protein [Rhodocytophaga rosea]QHT68560.1 DUF2490 domain-containing protein [Rhodocytophaga rosea]